MPVIITYENENHKQWVDKRGFSSAADADKYLKENGFKEAGRIYTKGPKGWSKGQKAYIQGIEII